MDLEPAWTLRFPHSRSLSENHIFEHAGNARENHMIVSILLLMLSQILVQAADSHIAPGSKPKNEGKIGAGDGPFCHPAGSKYYIGGNRTTRRNQRGNVS